MEHWVKQEDAHKIHAEINQLSGQRTLLSTLAITLFASIGTLIVAYKLELLFSVIISIILIIFLLFISYLSHTLRRISRCEALYLKLSNSTKWEGLWRQFREHKTYKGIKVAETRLFSMILICSAILPVHTYRIKPIVFTNYEIYIPIFFAIAGIFWVYSLEKKTIEEERDVEKKWEELLEAQRIRIDRVRNEPRSYPGLDKPAGI